MEQNRTFSVAWMLVSFLMTSGGLILTVMLLGVLRVESELVAYAALFLGGFVGGFFAGRASPGTTILEPALGSLLLFGSFVAMIASVPGVGEVISIIPNQGIMLIALIMGGLLGAGGLVGAVVGERTQAPRRSASRWRWVGISTLVTLGAVYFFTALLAIILLRDAASDGPLSGEASGFMVIVTLAGAAFLGGLVTQLIAPARMYLSAGAGFLVMILVGLLLGAIAGEGIAAPEGLAGLAIGLVGLGVGVLGAVVGWRLLAKRIQSQSQVHRVFE